MRQCGSTESTESADALAPWRSVRLWARLCRLLDVMCYVCWGPSFLSPQCFCLQAQCRTAAAATKRTILSSRVHLSSADCAAAPAHARRSPPRRDPSAVVRTTASGPSGASLSATSPEKGPLKQQRWAEMHQSRKSPSETVIPVAPICHK